MSRLTSSFTHYKVAPYATAVKGHMNHRDAVRVALRDWLFRIAQDQHGNPLKVKELQSITGLHRSDLGGIRDMTRDARPETVVRIAEAFGVPVPGFAVEVVDLDAYPEHTPATLIESATGLLGLAQKLLDGRGATVESGALLSMAEGDLAAADGQPARGREVPGTPKRRRGAR